MEIPGNTWKCVGNVSKCVWVKMYPSYPDEVTIARLNLKYVVQDMTLIQ